MRTPALVLALGALAACGCTGKTPTVPNPFNSADRVTPPSLITQPGGAPPYYQPGATAPAYQPGVAPSYGAPGAAAPYGQPAPTTFAPGQTTPSGYPAAPSGYPAAAPYAAPATMPGPAPGSATPYYGPPGGAAAVGSRGSAPVAGGDTIRVESDASALRFASPNDIQVARRGATPIQRPGGTTTQLASTPARRPATANAWIAGSAPVRSAVPAQAPRVRLPGDGYQREPVSVAALDRGVPIAPLEPATGGARPGEPAPLRVATPQSTTGWY